jgi:hypothetical protein
MEFILGKAKANQQLAEPYGLTSELIAKAEGLLEEFKSVKTSPRQATVSKVDINAKLVDAVAETDSLIKDKLDLIMKMIKFDKPTLYGQYKSARVIVDR